MDCYCLLVLALPSCKKALAVSTISFVLVQSIVVENGAVATAAARSHRSERNARYKCGRLEGYILTYREDSLPLRAREYRSFSYAEF